MKDIIEDILIYIEENIFLDELKIEDISAYFGYDKHHFSREFKRLTGYSLRESISSLKAEKTIELLEQEDRIMFIQSSVGYSSSGSFSNTFKKYTAAHLNNMTDLYSTANCLKQVRKKRSTLHDYFAPTHQGRPAYSDQSGQASFFCLQKEHNLE
jgi:AraC-like DNA-binding protein